ncbi:hypothetical protein ACGC1H_000320 [Rhizoctonia solani]
MSDRPFFRLSAGPGLPTEKSSTVLIVPVVSAGNVSQLCADLLIHTLLLRQVGIFDPGYYAPAVGGQDGEHSARISTPMELFGLPGGDIFVLQQRSPVLKVRTTLNRILFTLVGRTARKNLSLNCSKQLTRVDSARYSISLARTNQLGRMSKWGPTIT